MKPGTQRILVSDKNTNVRNFLRREFLRRGYEVVQAANAREVLDALYSPNPPRLLLMDMQLPGCEAPGFWHQVLTVPESPFVVVHAFSEDTLPEELNGKAARVPKDGDMESLARAVSWCLARSNGPK